MKINISKKGLKQYSQFKTSKEFHANLEMWLLENRGEFSKGELIGLKQLAYLSVKTPGVCNTTIGTILEAIHDEYYNNGISRTTFKRMIQKAKKIGVLTVYETKRQNGSQSSNLYVFNRFP